MGQVAGTKDDPLFLGNELLSVEMDPGRLTVRRYLHRPSGRVFGGAGPRGVLMVNGEPVPWEAWETEVVPATDRAVYRMALPSAGLALTWEIRLESSTLALRLAGLHDPGQACRSLAWRDLPLLTTAAPDLRFWRLTTTPPDAQAFGKMWAREERGLLAEARPEEIPVGAIFGALWCDRVCAFVDSNYPFFPQLHQIRSGPEYTVSLGEYRPRVRDRSLPLLEARVVFLEDYNGDGRVDLSEYRLWVNRRLPDGDPLYREAIWYKIFLSGAGVGVRTTLPQAEKIIRGIHRATDGLPQVIYLVGQQQGGHDGDYPTLCSLDESLGTAADHARLAAVCRDELNAVLSYHTNLDDAYRHSRDWSDGLVVPGGAAGEEESGVHGSVCHTRDAESGAVFRRLEAMLRVLPVARTLHFDNLRLTNTLGRSGFAGIGVLEELVCGMMPVMDWLADRGITVTTEGYNGLPIDPRLLVHGFWHHDCPDGARQILHRKIMGGGRGDHVGRYTTLDWGIANGIHQDFSYEPISRQSLGEEAWNRHFSWMAAHGDAPLTVSWREDLAGILDRIYCGVLLYQFYLEREMLSWEEIGGGVRMRFADGAVAEVGTGGPESLVVRQGEVVVADGMDRFVPRGESVYAYSPGGCEREWVLPESLRDRALRIFTLSPEGRGPAPEHTWQDRAVWLRLRPHQPVRLMPAGAA